jgi:hypothetical protein
VGQIHNSDQEIHTQLWLGNLLESGHLKTKKKMGEILLQSTKEEVTTCVISTLTVPGKTYSVLADLKGY